MNMLRSIRERKGLTVGQLAARASIPSRVLTEYEEGRQPIPLPHAKLLAKALWVQMEDLLPAAGTAPPTPDSRRRPPRPLAAPPKNISEGQIEELMRLAARLEIEQAKVEESMGKPIQALSRVEAKEWIKRLRDMAEEIGGATPGSKVRFGQWPGSREDREALYLA